MDVFPRAGTLTAWGTAYLLGGVSLDDADDAVTDPDALHRMVGVPGEDDAVTVAIALGRLRGRSVSGLRLVLPEPGDPMGLPGPPSLNASAVAAGEAVVTVGPVGTPTWAIVPTSVPAEGGAVVRWDVLEASPSFGLHGLPTLGEAERALSEAMASATGALAELDVAGGRDGVAARLADLDRRMRELHLPPTLSARAQRVLVSAARLRAIVAVATGSTGAATTAGEVARRAEALRPLRTASRYALCAAYSAAIEPSAAR